VLELNRTPSSPNGRVQTVKLSHDLFGADTEIFDPSAQTYGDLFDARLHLADDQPSADIWVTRSARRRVGLPR